VFDSRLARQQVDHFLLDQGRIDVHHDKPFGTTTESVGLDRHVYGAGCGKLDQPFPDLIDVPIRNDQLVADHRITGQPKDPFDVSSPGGDRGGDQAELVGADHRSDERHHGATAKRSRSRRHHFEVDMEVSLPGEVENLAHGLAFLVHTDQHVEGESPSDHDLLDVVEVDVATGEDVHQPGRDPRTVGSVYRNEDG